MASVQLVTFELAGEEYGIDINAINGIIKSKNYKIFKVPNSPDYLEGIINLRGKINPIFNLKKKFHIEDQTIHEDSKIIIVNNENSTVGFIVDEVTDIFRLKDEEIQPFPQNLNLEHKEHIKNIGRFEEKVIIILDLIKTLSAHEIEHLKTISDEHLPPE